MVSINLPSLDGGKFASLLVLRQAKREISGILDAIGPDNLRRGVETNTSFAEAFKGKENTLKEKLAQYKWASGILTEEAILGIMPEWVAVVVAEFGEQGQEWLKAQVAWFRNLLTGG